MQLELKVKSFWLQIVAICSAFFCFLSAKDAHALGLPPLITVPPLGVTVQNGGTATFTTTVGVSLTPLTITWYLNGNEIKNPNVSNLSIPIVGTTISTLTISPANPSRAGNYSVKVENGGGEVRSGNALLVVLNSNTLTNAILLGSQCTMTNGGFQLQLLKPAGSNCVLDATSDLTHWTPIYTNTTGSTNFSYLDSAATNLSLRYYRARLQ